jgi:hypothetical protein
LTAALLAVLQVPWGLRWLQQRRQQRVAVKLLLLACLEMAFPASCSCNSSSRDQSSSSSWDEN